MPKKTIEAGKKESSAARRRRAARLVRGLRAAYPDADCALNHENALQLLVATILSAQCTDERVNQVTPSLFARYPNARAYAAADPDELEELIRSTGFFRNKARSILGLGRALVERHGGEVPREMEQLIKLPGVGRKTANVLRGTWFHLPGITVDTHVKRLSQRLGLTTHSDPVKIEFALQEIFPENDWTFTSHALILHGRQICAARRPECDRCALKGDCPFPAR
jgi:endonuclease-3